MTSFVPSNVVNTNIFDGPTEIDVDGTFIGATSGGVELQVKTEMGEQTADQTPLLLKSYIKSQRAMLVFNLEDLSLQNMAYVFGTSAVSGAGAGNETLIGLHQVTFKGHGPNDTTRTCTIWKARFSGNTSAKYVLGETVVYKVELIMESDTSQPDGQRYFAIADA
jgi:hypothetical protein